MGGGHRGGAGHAGRYIRIPAEYSCGNPLLFTLQ